MHDEIMPRSEMISFWHTAIISNMYEKHCIAFLIPVIEPFVS